MTAFKQRIGRDPDLKTRFSINEEDMTNKLSYIIFKLVAPHLIYVNAKNKATVIQRHLKLFNDTIKSFSEGRFYLLLNNELL